MAQRLAAEEKFRALEEALSRLPGAVVGLSGGVDSGTLLFLCLRALGRERVLAATADSPIIPRAEIEGARTLAASLGVEHRLVPTKEMDLPEFRRNPPDRCALCKAWMVERFQELGKEKGGWPFLLGANADDLKEDRPGEMAARRLGALMPLQDAGITKGEIRAFAREMGLPCWDKPPRPCLATRIPTGEEITAERLARIEAAEEALMAMGFSVVRVRDHGRWARIETAPERAADLLRPGVRERVVEALRKVGYERVALDLEGYLGAGG